MYSHILIELIGCTKNIVDLSLYKELGDDTHVVCISLILWSDTRLVS